MENNLNELKNDLMSMFTKPKPKKLKPLVKQITYKNRVVKWAFDGASVNFVKGPSYVFDLAKLENETVKDFVKRMIDEGGV